MNTHYCTLKSGIDRTEEFEKKGLASHSVNVGTKCGHDCAYCSTGAVLRRHNSFRAAGESPFRLGYAIVDPSTPERVARDARRIEPDKRGMVQLCTLVDAWAPEAQAHDLGRRCLEAILQEPGWSVRVLTKNAAVIQDFELIEKHRDRVLVGLSITGSPESAGPVSALEPNASSLEERMAAMAEAHRRGLRTYGMFCPLSPGIGDSKAQVEWLIEFAVRCGVEEIFVEPVNARGSALPHCENHLRDAGFDDLADQMHTIRTRTRWSRYVTELIGTVQASVRRHSDIQRLRFLLYPGNLTPSDYERIKQSDEGVVWLREKVLSGSEPLEVEAPATADMAEVESLALGGSVPGSC